jgi:hypothetical protein
MRPLCSGDLTRKEVEAFTLLREYNFDGGLKMIKFVSRINKGHTISMTSRWDQIFSSIFYPGSSCSIVSKTFVLKAKVSALVVAS